MTKQQQFSTLNGLRGLAAIAVVTIHGQGFFGSWLFPSGYLAVDLFFLLSGFVLAYAYESRFAAGLKAKEFFLLRLIRFYPLYLAGTLIGILSAVAAWAMSGGVLTSTELVISVTAAIFMLPSPVFTKEVDLFPVNSPAWSLFYELFINTVYALVWSRLSATVLKLTVLVSGIVLAIWTIYHGNLDLGPRWATFLGGFVRVCFSFFAGVLLYRLSYGSRRSISLVWPLATGTMMLAVFAVSVSVAFRPWFDLACALAFFPALVALGSRFEPSGITLRSFETLGLASYGLYAIHFPMFELARRIARVSQITPERLAPIAGFAGLITLIVAALVLTKGFDEPVRKRLVGMWRHWEQQRAITRDNSAVASLAAKSGGQA